MCIGCTISKHWAPALKYLESGEYDLNQLPSDLSLRITKAKHISETENVSLKEALHKLFLLQHTRKEDDTNQTAGMSQRFPSKEAQQYWEGAFGG
jgi:hypothetical protein